MGKEVNTLKPFLGKTPYPIASIISKYLRLSEDKVYDRHSVLGDLFEVIVKFFGIILIKEAYETDPKIKKRFPNGLDFLKHPSLGHWVSIIREFGSDEYENKDIWLSKIAQWYKSNDDSGRIRRYYDDLPEITFPRGNTKNEGIINSLVTYRNKVWKGHGAVNLNSAELEKRIFAIESLLASCISDAEFLIDMNVFYTQEVKKIDSANFQANCISLVGTDLSSSTYIYGEIEPQEIYLAYSSEKQLGKKPILLSPLLEWKQNVNNEYQLYFFNDAKRTKLEYLSYLDASFYYHKEVKKELDKIFNISLIGDQNSEIFNVFGYSDEERKEQSDFYFKKGLELASKNNWEAAIIAYEDALEWHRHPKLIVEICKCLIELNDDQTYILNTLDSALELDPRFEPAIELKKEIEEDSFKESKNENQYFTYFEFFLPEKIRKFALVFYLSLLFGIFSIFALIMILADQENYLEHLTYSAIILIHSVIMIIGLTAVRNKLKDEYFSLLGQQASMRPERFFEWYDKSMKNMFGHFAWHKDKNSALNRRINLGTDCYSPKWVYERFFFWPAFLFTASWGISAFAVQDLLSYPALVGFSRLFLTVFAWALLTPIARFIITSTFFTRDYSLFDLKPVVFNRRVNGFRSLTRLFSNTLVLFLIFWLNLLSWNLLATKGPAVLDFFGLGIAVLIVMFWIVYTPLYLKRAIKIAKNKVLNEFDNHVQNLFKKYIKNPDKNSLDNFEWLMNNQKPIRKISTSIFGFFDWLIFCFSIIVLIGTMILYAMHRFEIINIDLFIWL